MKELSKEHICIDTDSNVIMARVTWAEGLGKGEENRDICNRVNHKK